MSREPITFSAWVYFGLCVLTIVDAFVGLPILVNGTVGLIVLFVILQFTAVPRPQQIAAVVLIGIGLAGAAVSGEWQTVLTDGIARSRVFLLLFFAVSWLQIPVGESPSLRATRATIVNQPPGRRFLVSAFGVHFLGAVLNLAGLALLTTMVERQSDPLLRRRLCLTLMHGFTSASCWSPFYIGMIVVLVALPSLRWAELAPTGMLMAVVIILVGWAYDRLAYARSGTHGRVESADPLSAGNFFRTVGILAALIGVAMLAVEITGTSIPIALGIIGPPVALIWFGTMGGGLVSLRSSSSDLANRAISRLPSLRNESLVFVAANILGVGIASAIPTEDLGEVVRSALPWADLRIVVLIFLFFICSMIGLHPVIVVISISALLPPEAMGLSDWIVGIIFIGVWGICTMVSPFSGTTLFMSRVAGVPAYVIGWRWSPPMALLSAAAISVFVIALRHAVG